MCVQGWDERMGKKPYQLFVGCCSGQCSVNSQLGDSKAQSSPCIYTMSNYVYDNNVQS